MNPKTDFGKTFLSGLKTGSWADWQSWLVSEPTQCGKSPLGDEPELDHRIIDDLIDMCRDPYFLASDRAHQALHFVETEWGRIGTEQLELLLAELVRGYSLFHDPTARFVVVELLGEYFANESGLSALLALKTTEFGETRAILPMGFQLLARYGTSKAIRDLALSSFMDFGRSEEAERVHTEYGESLRRLQRLGVLGTDS